MAAWQDIADRLLPTPFLYVFFLYSLFLECRGPLEYASDIVLLP